MLLIRQSAQRGQRTGSKHFVSAIEAGIGRQVEKEGAAEPETYTGVDDKRECLHSVTAPS